MNNQDNSIQPKLGVTYRDAGVDIDAGNEAVARIKSHVQRTSRSEVLTDIGGFGGLFALDIKKYQNPVLVSGTDGVGTKLRVALMLQRYDTIGIDAVAMCVNDILVQGAEPLFFLDYLAVGKLIPQQVEQIVKGIADGCQEAGCALIGGETAEMPGFYAPSEFDVAGFAVGVVDRPKIIDGSTIELGDILLGLPSTGLHSNGYSLARKVLFELGELTPHSFMSETGKTIGEELLTPTKIYVKAIKPLFETGTVKGLAHITGGGLLENIPRILPKGTAVELKLHSWPVQAIFSLIQRLGQVELAEMYRAFNMGIGMVIAVAPKDLPQVKEILNTNDEKFFEIGRVISGDGQVKLK
ncbi:MAG: phosphoribosylformylglycinamidine cyclo-ligase [Bacillota bacterium]|nr:phosphoribosylformylglycinamidine cyclo-ligase [Bacillota bacterium]